MNLSSFSKLEGFNQLSQHAAPFCFELAGKTIICGKKELAFASAPAKTVTINGKAHTYYAAKATDALVFALADETAFIIETETGASISVNKKEQDWGLGTATQETFFAKATTDLAENTLEWHLGSSKDAVIITEFTSAGCKVGIESPMKLSLKVDDFVVMNVGTGVYFIWGRCGFGPMSGTLAMVGDFTKILFVGAAIVLGDVIPAGGYGRFVEASK